MRSVALPVGGDIVTVQVTDVSDSIVRSEANAVRCIGRSCQWRQLDRRSRRALSAMSGSRAVRLID